MEPDFGWFGDPVDFFGRATGGSLQGKALKNEQEASWVRRKACEAFI